jgi:hypothetical protein
MRWLLEATLCAVWIGAGFALFFFVDRLLAWQIKLLQSKDIASTCASWDSRSLR